MIAVVAYRGVLAARRSSAPFNNVCLTPPPAILLLFLTPSTAFGEQVSWPGEHVKGLFRGSSHWARPRELIPEVITAATPATGSGALAQSVSRSGFLGSSRGARVPAPQLLASLRELSTHTPSGYLWPNCVDRWEGLFRGLHALLGVYRGRESLSLFGSKEVAAENKVVRLAYAHLDAAVRSDAALARTHLAAAIVAAGDGASSSSSFSSSSSSSSSSAAAFALPSELALTLHATAEAELLTHDFLPRRCLAAGLYVKFN